MEKITVFSSYMLILALEKYLEVLLSAWYIV